MAWTIHLSRALDHTTPSTRWSSNPSASLNIEGRLRRYQRKNGLARLRDRALDSTVRDGSPLHPPCGANETHSEAKNGGAEENCAYSRTTGLSNCGGNQTSRSQLRSEVQAVYGDKAPNCHRHPRAKQEWCAGMTAVASSSSSVPMPRPRGCPPKIARDAHGYVLTGDDAVKAGRWSHNRDPDQLETSVPGTFACGDVWASKVKRVASAVGEGSMTIAFVHQYLQHAASA